MRDYQMDAMMEVLLTGCQYPNPHEHPIRHFPNPEASKPEQVRKMQALSTMGMRRIYYRVLWKEKK